MYILYSSSFWKCTAKIGVITRQLSVLGKQNNVGSLLIFPVICIYTQDSQNILYRTRSLEKAEKVPVSVYEQFSSLTTKSL